ncbi:MAG: serine hydroxymethyltransferase [Phycisphaerae bacterium]
MSALEQTDPRVAEIIRSEQTRQNETLELIASENHTSRAVMEASGSCLTDKYAEGYPHRRWYCGNEYIDAVEELAIARIRELFGVEYANVQPHSGTSANIAVYMAALEPGDKVMGMRLDHGGHLSHGMKLNFSGRQYEIVSYGVREDNELIDYDQLREQAMAERPKMLVVGASAYPRVLDFQKLGEIAREAECLLLADIAHIAGLVAAGVHPCPAGQADFITTTTHKTLRGPRGGVIMAKEDWARKLNVAVFPGIQGGPLMHAIAAKAVAFGEAMTDGFKQYARNVVSNARTLAEALGEAGWRLVSGGTDNHLLLVDLRSRNEELTGAEASEWLEAAGIIANKNGIPFDPRPPIKTSGVRLGTAAVTTRGMGGDEMRRIAAWIDQVLASNGDEKAISQVRGQVRELCERFPVPNSIESSPAGQD